MLVLLFDLSYCSLQIIRLESERTQWEQRYLEESAMRQVAIDAASIPKDAKIAALEKNSAESEKMIAEARSDKIKQLEEMQGTQVCYFKHKSHKWTQKKPESVEDYCVKPEKNSLVFCVLAHTEMHMFAATRLLQANTKCR